MFKKIWKRLTEDPGSQRLDALHQAADERIAEREKRLASLEATNQQLQQKVDTLKDAVSRAEKTLNRGAN
jgi:uncharacterized protein (DUF3084 family)